MYYLKGLKKNLSTLITNTPTESEEKFQSMSTDDLLSTANNLDLENKQLKEKYAALLKENTLLKNSIISNNKENNQSSQFGSFLDNMKDIYLNNNNKNCDINVDNLKTFLYEQRMMYGGIEEENEKYNEIFGEIGEEDWGKNRSSTLLRQNLMIKNYNELYRTFINSKEINMGLNGKNSRISEKIEKIRERMGQKKDNDNDKDKGKEDSEGIGEYEDLMEMHISEKEDYDKKENIRKDSSNNNAYSNKNVNSGSSYKKDKPKNKDLLSDLLLSNDNDEDEDYY